MRTLQHILGVYYIIFGVLGAIGTLVSSIPPSYTGNWGTFAMAGAALLILTGAALVHK